MHHRRISLDSRSFAAAASRPHQAYTLQGGPITATNLGVTIKMTPRLHSSPLSTAAAAAMSTSCSPPLNSLRDIEMDEEMERMVSSVVSSLVEPPMASVPSPPHSAISSLGLALPGPLQSQQTRARNALSSPPIRCLLGGNADYSHLNSPKLNIGTRAAFGNFRKRLLSGESVPGPPTPEVKVSLPSPKYASALHSASQAIAKPNDNGLLSPPEVFQSQVSSRGSPGTRFRRSASVGTIPSLDQIRDWSLRRHSAASEDFSAPSCRQQYSMTPPPPGLTNALQPPAIQILGATPPGPIPDGNLPQLSAIFQARTRVSRQYQAVSMPSSPVEKTFWQQAIPICDSEDRTQCAKQMVSVLERRRSLSLVC